MGDKFTPSLANLFMAYWEREVIDTNPPRELRLWRRYVDDVLLLWFKAFFSSLNSNDRGISLQYEISQFQIHFLDLNISVRDGCLTTTTYFKETDCNAFILPTSCHDSSWLNAVPKGQFQQIRKNCTSLVDYQQQAQILKSRFLDKPPVAPCLLGHRNSLQSVCFRRLKRR